MISETVKWTQVICCPTNADPRNVGKAIDLDLIVEREALVDDLVSTDIQVLQPVFLALQSTFREAGSRD
jgi:hypothetical protein